MALYANSSTVAVLPIVMVRLLHAQTYKCSASQLSRKKAGKRLLFWEGPQVLEIIANLQGRNCLNLLRPLATLLIAESWDGRSRGKASHITHKRAGHSMTFDKECKSNAQ